MSRAFLILAGLLILSVCLNLYLLVEMATGKPVFQNLAQESHAIQNVTNIFSTIGALIAVVGLILAVDQLRQAKDQARAQAVYTALKDVRETAATASHGDRFNLYYALFEQKRLGVFSDDMWNPVRQDIEATLTDTAAKNYWTTHKGNYPKEFRDELATINGGA